MSTTISSMSSGPSWEGIKETALENDKLAADIRVSDDAVQVNGPGMLQRFKVAIGFEKAPVYASREETLTNLREQFGLDFSQKLRALIQETGIRTDSEEYRTLVTHAMQSFDVITQKLTTTIATPAISTSQAIQEAHLGSLNSLALLRQQFATPQLTPQFCRTSEGKWSVLQPAPHPENFVLSGGGVKGAGYVGWFKAAEKFGVLKNLKRIAGSSAGAMTAALIASGMSAEDLKKANDRTSFWSILTGTSSDPIINAATKLETKGWLSRFSFSGTYAVDHLNQEMVGSINKYFKTFKDNEAFKGKIEQLKIDGSVSDKEKETLQKLYQKITPPPPHWLFGSFFQKKQSTYMVKFEDLAALAKIDPRFKELTVTGYAAGKGERCFNATSTPDLEIATAVRGSMALPGAFNPVIIDGEKIEDGGVGSNTPAEVFKDLPRAKTLVLQFENNGRFDQVVYGPGEDQKPAGFVAREEEAAEEEIAGNPNLAKDAQRDREKLHEAGPNAMMVAAGDLGTVSFTASQERLRQAQRQAEIRATEAFSLRQDQAVDHVFNSLEEAMKGMSSRELENIAVHYVSKSDGKDLLPEADRQAISKAAQDELATRAQTELPLSV
ncbi:MAG: patatin-like phospholipase family protein [Chthoniobacterales bacterium]|nr:patatin-like phospholipase family protein [Chthoniobacterales bacterium]